MKKFTSEGSFEIEGRGKVFVVSNDVDREGEFSDFYPQVEIDGKVYKVRGIERQAILSQRKGCKLGILVSEIEQDEN